MKKRIQNFLDKIGQYNRLVNDYKRAVDSAPDHALAYVNWGIELAQDGRVNEALAKFEQASVISPHRYEIYLNWGVALAKLNRLDEAIEKFREATEKDRKASNPYILWGAALMSQGETEKAKEKYEKAVTLNPENPEAFVNWGIALARTGAYHEAIKSLKRALAIHGYQPQVYFLWGAILAELQDYESAIEKFQITLRFLPKHAEAYYFWSVALNRLGKYEAALEKSRKAIGLDMEKPEVYLNQGDILANLNRLDVAIDNYRHAVTLKADLPEAHLSWGIALCRQGQYEAGYEHFAKSQEQQADLPGVAQHWGHFLMEQKRFAEAIPHLKTAISQDPRHLDSLLNLSMALIKTHQQEEAIQLLFTIEKMDKWNPNAHHLLGTHFMGAGDLNSAKNHFEMALAEKPDMTDASVNLALALCEMGETLEAVRRMRPVIRRNPDSAKMNFFYGVILYRHGDYKEALIKYQKAISLDPTLEDARIGLGEVYLRLSKTDAAEQVLQNALQNNASSVPSLYLLGLCLLRKGDAVRAQAESDKDKDARVLYAEALKLFERAIQLDPDHLEAQANRALLLGKLESLQALDHAFHELLASQQSALKGIILYYWAKSLKQLDQLALSEEKMRLAHLQNPNIENEMQNFSI